MEQKDMKKFFMVQYIIIGLLVVVCLFLIIDRFNTKESAGSNSQGESLNNNGYDISMMNEVSVSNVLDMFNNKKSYLLYIGRETCGVCKTILPKLQNAQNDLDYITQYLDITKVDRNSSDWEKLEDLFDVETTLSVNVNGESEIKTETYGYFIGNYGYTPTLIIINNNKMVAGHIGDFGLDELKDWLQENGIG